MRLARRSRHRRCHRVPTITGTVAALHMCSGTKTEWQPVPAMAAVDLGGPNANGSIRRCAEIEENQNQ
jgi:hypothetical protein